MDLKMVLVVRTDLKMKKGKLAVQVAHAAVSAAEETRRIKPRLLSTWFLLGQKKIVVGIPSIEDMRDLEQECLAGGTVAVLIQDAGLTQLPPGTVTALGIGPAPSSIVDPLTCHLKLL